MMRILYIYRHPDMGHSIRRVFAPIEREMGKYCEVDSISLPVPNYSLRGLALNIKTAVNAVRKGKYDVVHITGAEHYLIPFLRLVTRSKVVVTVHDMASLSLKSNGARVALKHLLFVKSLAMADAVACISNATAQECQKMVNMNSVHLFVIGNAVDPAYEYCPKEYGTECPVVLHIGTKWNKNLTRTIHALEGLPVHLRIIGVPEEKDLQLLKEKKLNFSIVHNVSDEQMVQEYQNCDIVSFPSLYEGFGMPIIEGQAIGRPVVTSNIPPMIEVAGDGAILVDPKETGSIREAYQTLISNGDCRDSLVSLGKKNVERFHVKNIAERYYRVYQDVVRTDKSL